MLNRVYITMRHTEAKGDSFGPRGRRLSGRPDRGPNLLPCSAGSRAEDGENFENGTENPQMAAVVPVVLDVPKRPINGQSEPGSWPVTSCSRRNKESMPCLLPCFQGFSNPLSRPV